MDVDFKVDGFLLTKRNSCKCSSLFRTVPSDLKTLNRKINTIVKLWRYRTKELSDKNVISNHVKIQCMRNCPPSIGRYSGKKTKLRFCVFYSCPWCWNRRYCEKVFKSLKEHIKENSQTKLYYLVKIKKYNKTFYDSAPQIYYSSCKAMATLRTKLTRRKNILGGFITCYLIPSNEGFKVITKAIVSSKKIIKPIDDFKLFGKTKSNYRAAVAFGRYPTVFLKQQTDDDMFINFLGRQVARTRKFISFGQLYNRRK
jgi:hypothetical protein